MQLYELKEICGKYLTSYLTNHSNNYCEFVVLVKNTHDDIRSFYYIKNNRDTDIILAHSKLIVSTDRKSIPLITNIQSATSDCVFSIFIVFSENYLIATPRALYFSERFQYDSNSCSIYKINLTDKFYTKAIENYIFSDLKTDYYMNKYKVIDTKIIHKDVLINIAGKTITEPISLMVKFYDLNTLNSYLPGIKWDSKNESLVCIDSNRKSISFLSFPQDLLPQVSRFPKMVETYFKVKTIYRRVKKYIGAHK